MAVNGWLISCANAVGHFAHRGDAGQVGQLFPALPILDLGLNALGDIACGRINQLSGRG